MSHKINVVVGFIKMYFRYYYMGVIVITYNCISYKRNICNTKKTTNWNMRVTT